MSLLGSLLGGSEQEVDQSTRMEDRKVVGENSLLLGATGNSARSSMATGENSVSAGGNVTSKDDNSSGFIAGSAKVGDGNTFNITQGDQGAFEAATAMNETNVLGGVLQTSIAAEAITTNNAMALDTVDKQTANYYDAMRELAGQTASTSEAANKATAMALDTADHAVSTTAQLAQNSLTGNLQNNAMAFDTVDRTIAAGFQFGGAALDSMDLALAGNIDLAKYAMATTENANARTLDSMDRVIDNYNAATLQSINNSHLASQNAVQSMSDLGKTAIEGYVDNKSPALAETKTILENQSDNSKYMLWTVAGLALAALLFARNGKPATAR
ncbi:MAG: hypothetical protein LBK99_06470 [Opitutaceae bacterium]|jgi:hypothetical protein|nr:hypothetical protein [Opitutaceae bacterium]